MTTASSSTALTSSSSPVLSAPGVGSGLDVNSMVSKLMAVEQLPLADLNTKETAFQSQLSAYGTLQSVLSSLQTAMTSLSTPSTFQTMTATLGNTSLGSTTAGTGAQAGNYSLTVNSLAQSQKLMSADYASTSSVVGTGTLTIQFGTYSGGASSSFTPNTSQAAKTITIDSSDNTLSGMRDAINAANAGVSASIVNDGSGNRLVLTSTQSGTSNAMRISVADGDGNNTDASGLSSLAYDASSGGTANMTQTLAATDANLSVDGMTIVQPTNTITNAIQGVTLNLAATGGPTTLSVAQNTGAITTAVNNFVSAYNSANSAISQMDAYNSSTGTAAVLQGDTTLLSIQSQLRKLLNTPLSPAVGGLQYIAQAGISFQLDGSLSLDTSQLQKVLSDPSKNLSALFADNGTATDSLVSFSSAASSAQSGSYAINVTQPATHGSATGDMAAGLTITTGVNDTLNLIVDGQSTTVTLPAGTYSADSLASQLQSQINADPDITANASSVTVSQSGGVLSVASNSYGSSSAVSILGGDAASGLFGTASSTAGQDVAGSIGGVTASGNGQLLSAQGLTVQVSGGATGDRGTLNFAHGFASQINSLMTNVLSTQGPIQARVNGINTSITDINNQRSALNIRLADIQAAYQAQFNALDTLLSSMQSTQSYLTTELASLPGFTTSSSKSG
jgi:flagellar hook-associated protein 2